MSNPINHFVVVVMIENDQGEIWVLTLSYYNLYPKI